MNRSRQKLKKSLKRNEQMLRKRRTDGVGWMDRAQFIGPSGRVEVQRNE